MGVMECDRKGCQNILCDRYNSTYGYICDECFEELENKPLPVDILQFMDTEKGELANTQHIKGWLNSIFPLS